MRKMKMKALPALALLAVVALAAAVLAGCAGGPNAGKVKSTQVIEVLGHKNQALGGDKMPDWVVAYRDEGGNTGVMALPKFKDSYAFVGQATASTQVMATEWASSFDARQQVSTAMVSGVATTLQATRNAQENRQGNSNAELSSLDNTGKVDDDIKNALSAISMSQVSGLRQEGDYWLLTRTHNTNGSTTDQYVALVLYVIDRKKFDSQVSDMLEEVKKNAPNMIGLITAAQATISQNGVEYGAPGSN
jgi:hypothetical protein